MNARTKTLHIFGVILVANNYFCSNIFKIFNLLQLKILYTNRYFLSRNLIVCSQIFFFVNTILFQNVFGI